MKVYIRGNEVYTRSSETEAVFYQDRNEQLIIFFKMLSFEYNTLIPLTFLSVEAPLKHQFWYGLQLSRCIYSITCISVNLAFQI